MDEKEEGFINRYHLRVIFGIAFVLVVGVAVYLTFYDYPQCGSYQCFQDHMTACTKAVYINEEPEASWQYTVLGQKNGQCAIEVTMLLAKKGDLGIDALNGQSMLCSYPIGITAYPEKNLDVCTGQLKESLQSVLIKKLYSYILDNLGQYNKSLSSALGG